MAKKKKKIRYYLKKPKADPGKHVYQNTAAYVTKKNVGKKRIGIGQAREDIKNIVKQHKEMVKLGLRHRSYLVQLLKRADGK